VTTDLIHVLVFKRINSCFKLHNLVVRNLKQKGSEHKQYRPLISGQYLGDLAEMLELRLGALNLLLLEQCKRQGFDQAITQDGEYWHIRSRIQIFEYAIM
jgi:hypothetical protein